MAGIEPATDGLRNRCSTAELHWRHAFNMQNRLSSALFKRGHFIFGNKQKQAEERCAMPFTCGLSLRFHRTGEENFLGGAVVGHKILTKIAERPRRKGGPHVGHQFKKYAGVVHA